MVSPIRTRDQAVQYLLDRINYERTIDIPYGERRFKLDRMQKLAGRLGDPHRQLKIVHVAGSKGKGSTCTMIAAMLTACGYRTGLFTSPHLQRLEERISIDTEPISATELRDQVNAISPVIAALDQEAIGNGTPWDTPTFFELITAIGLKYFADHQTEAVVLEVGLGGRLDSTNIGTPICSVITSIGLDHTRQLGDTLAQIAAEKAGIIKPGVPVVSGVTTDEARSVIRETASERDSPLWELGRDFAAHYSPVRRLEPAGPAARRPQFDFEVRSGSRLPGSSLADVEMAMLGRHQADNAALGLAVMAVLTSQGFRLPAAGIRAGLAEAKCQSRIEIVASQPTTVLDTAHNDSSMHALLATLDESFPQSRADRVVILAATRGKDVREMLRMLIPWCRHMVLTQYLENPRGFHPQKLLAVAQQIAQEFDEHAEFWVAGSPAMAVETAQRLVSDESLLCITGSFFLAAEIDELVRAK